MKRKLSFHLSQQVAERLEAAARRLGARKSSIVEDALDRLLNPDGDESHAATPSRRLDQICRQLTQLDYDLRVVSETVALHARYHLSVTPPLRVADQRAACDLGGERFEVFAAQVARRVHLGTPLMTETMERLMATSPDLFADDMEQAVPLGTQVKNHEPGAGVSAAADGEAEEFITARDRDQ